MKRNSSSEELLRKKILKQRGKRCEICGFEGYVEMHHINPMNNGGINSPENVLILCEKCHANMHGAIKRKYFDINCKYYHDKLRGQ